jgi:hypothetical protein
MVIPNETNDEGITTENKASLIRRSDASATEEIDLDAVFLGIIKSYVAVVKFINKLQLITKKATYKILMGVACTVLFIYVGLTMYSSYIQLNNSIEAFNKTEQLFKTVSEREMQKAFLNDNRLFWGTNKEYLSRHYYDLIRLMNDEFMHLKVHNEYEDQFMNDSTNVGIVITAFPLLLTTAWWTNLITISAALLNKCAHDGKLGQSFVMMLIVNLSCGTLLLAVHALNTVMLISTAYMKKGLP